MSILLERYIKEQIYQENLNEVTVKELVLGLGVLTGLGSLAYNYVSKSNNLPQQQQSTSQNDSRQDIESILTQKIKRKNPDGLKIVKSVKKNNFNAIKAMALLTGENPDNYGVIERGKLILTVDYIIKILKAAEDSNVFSTHEEGHIFGKGKLNKYIAAFESIEKVAVETGIPIESASEFGEWQEDFLVNGDENLAAFFADALDSIDTEADSFFDKEIKDISNLAESDINALMKLIAQNQSGTSDIDTGVYTVLSCLSSSIKQGRLESAYDLITDDLKPTLDILIQQIEDLRTQDSGE